MNKQKTKIKSSHDHLYIKLLNSKPDLVRFFIHTTINIHTKTKEGIKLKKLRNLPNVYLINLSKPGF